MAAASPFEIEVIRSPSLSVLSGMNRLIPQLSSSSKELTMEFLGDLLSNESVNLLVAKDTESNDIVGTLTLVIFAIPTGTRAWIEDVITDSALRGRGIAKLLVSSAISLARTKGAKTVDLTSRPSRVEANGLYIRMGFETRETNVYRFVID